jgi:hypothetical protein
MHYKITLDRRQLTISVIFVAYSVKILSDYLRTKEIIDNPVIIGHNCGFKDDPLLKVYSQEATRHCVDVAAFVEIDVQKIFKEWHYQHYGLFGVGERFFSVRMSRFLAEFKAAREYSGRNDVGLFLDMKQEFRNLAEIDSFMNMLASAGIEGASIMICVHQSFIKQNGAVPVLRLLDGSIKTGTGSIRALARPS